MERGKRRGARQRHGAGDAHGECPRRAPAIPPNWGPNGLGDRGWGRASCPKGRGSHAGMRPARPEPREPGHRGQFPAAFRGSRRRINAAERHGGSNAAEGLGPASGAPWAGVCSGVQRNGARGSAEVGGRTGTESDAPASWSYREGRGSRGKLAESARVVAVGPPVT